MKESSKTRAKTKTGKISSSTKRIILISVGAFVLLWALMGVAFWMDRAGQTIDRITYKETRTYDSDSWPDSTPYKIDTKDRAAMKQAQKLLDEKDITPTDEFCVNDFAKQTTRVSNTKRHDKYEVVIYYTDGTVQDMSCEFDNASASQLRQAREFREELWSILWAADYRD